MEEILFSFERCHVYKLPPRDFLVSESWEGNHIWTGLIKVVRNQTSQECSVKLEDATTGQLFGNCPLHADTAGPKSFQLASDSSRSFVLRVEQGDQHAYIGINFEGREAAYQFRDAILERNRHNRNVEALPVHDRGLRSGEKIHVDIAGKLKTGTPQGSSQGSPAFGTGSGLGGLKPPPTSGAGASRRIRVGEPAQAQQQQAQQAPVQQTFQSPPQQQSPVHYQPTTPPEQQQQQTQQQPSTSAQNNSSNNSDPLDGFF